VIRGGAKSGEAMRGSAWQATPQKESKKNSSKLADEKSGENTPKITKKKSDPYNLETRFTHKDQLY
jgi:hypothetical protein